MTQEICPLCRSAKHMRRAKPLYNVPVCKKCYYKFASRRQSAYVIDAVAFWIFSFLVSLPLVMVLMAAQLAEEDIDLIVTVLAWAAFPLLFFLKDGFAGYSLGKVICGVQVVDKAAFQPINFGQSFKRNLPLIIPFMPLIVAFLLQKGYRIGDGWAKTKVIWKKYANHPVFTGQLACENCQYNLTENTSGVCPECGTPVPRRTSVNNALLQHA